MSDTAAKPIERIEDTILTNSNAVTNDHASLEEAFPDVDPGIQPFGNLVLLQIRRPRKFMASGIELPSEARATEYYNTQVAKVLAVGPLCFTTVRNIGGEEKLCEWPEGPWFKVGDYVRAPKYGGDRFGRRATVTENVKHIGQSEATPVEVVDDIIFALFKAKDIQGVITCDPRAIRAYLD